MQAVTPSGTAHYVNVFRPGKPMDETKDGQYSITLTIAPDHPKLAAFRKKVEEVATLKFGAKAKQMLEKGQLKNPIRDGNEKDDEHFQGKVFITARSNDKPQVVDMDAEPVMDQDDFYSGCLARAVVYIFAYEKAGNKGVSMILNSVQKLGDGERLAGRRSAASAFAEED